MALTNTLYTGLSGLNVNQTKLNVTGNNIANVNTTAFKSSRTLFKPQFYVTDGAGSPPSAQFGGTNPSQRGLGAQVATIEKDLTGGTIETTGRNTDMAITGEGYFVVKGKDTSYTRDGSFTLNPDNMLVNQAGMFVQGFSADTEGNVIEGVTGNLEIPLGTIAVAKQTEAIDLKGNLNSDGPISSGASILATQAMQIIGGGTPTATTPLKNLESVDTPGTPLFSAGTNLSVGGKRGDASLARMTLPVGAGTTLGDLMDFMKQAMAIDTSTAVTAAAPTGFTPGATLAAAAGGGVTLNLTGNAGVSNTLDLTGDAIKYDGGTAPLFFSEAAASNPVGEGTQTTVVAYDSLGTPMTINVTMALESKSDAGNTWRWYATSTNDTNSATFTNGQDGSIVGSGTMVFDNTGKLASSEGNAINILRTDTGAATPLQATMDFSNLTSLNQDSIVALDSQDGQAAGELSSFTVGNNGVITGNFSNGLKKPLGQLALATFDNPLGLDDRGGNLFNTGASSGEPIITSPLELKAGGIQSGALEGSNVDLSEEFINMIVASTGFSAASRVISTADELMTELLNTTR